MFEETIKPKAIDNVEVLHIIYDYQGHISIGNINQSLEKSIC